MAFDTFHSSANLEFTLALLNKFSNLDNKANILYSPLSISAALAMLMHGAGGYTATEILQVLRVLAHEPPHPEGEALNKTEGTQNHQDVTAFFGQLLHELEMSDVLSVANRLYGDKSYTFIQAFLDEIKEHHNSELETVDFENSADAAKTTINNWVEEKTKGKILNLLSSDSADDSMKLVLVNAIAFKGKWKFPFNEESTIDGEFRLTKIERKPVNMMRMKGSFHVHFVEEANCKILELPYKSEELSMIIILPIEIEDDTTGLDKLEKELTYDKFKKWTGKDAMDQTEVEVRLPRFKMEKGQDLKEVLISMGMKDAFDVNKSNLSGMSEANDLVLSKAVHKAYVEVNEGGTEAAASTAAVLVERAAMITEIFIADHPFLFFIKHNSSNSVLFAGRFCSPE